VPVADYQPVAVLVDQLGVRGDVGLHLALQRDRQHPPGALAEQLVQIGGQLGPCLLVNHYTQHRGVPSSPAFTAPASSPTGQGGRYAAFSCERLIHSFRP
jgi:hypothetical protein